MMKRRNILERAEKIPHQRKTGYGIRKLTLKDECTWKIHIMKKKYFVHVILAHHSQNVIFGLSDERAGSLLNIKENTENENSTVLLK